MGRRENGRPISLQTGDEGTMGIDTNLVQRTLCAQIGDNEKGDLFDSAVYLKIDLQFRNGTAACACLDDGNDCSRLSAKYAEPLCHKRRYARQTLIPLVRRINDAR